MELNEPARAVERRRVPRVMRVAAALTCVACVISLYAVYHHWAAPYTSKTDLRYGRIVAIIAALLVITWVGVWLYRVAGRRKILAVAGSLLMVPAVILSVGMVGVLLSGARPIVASEDYDAAATEFSAYFAQLSGPRPELREARETALRLLNGAASPEKLREAMRACHQVAMTMDQEAEEIARLQEHGREMFERRGVGSARIDAYFAWKQPLLDEIALWADTSARAAARFRQFESELATRLGDAPSE